jgi:hypothetical protein
MEWLTVVQPLNTISDICNTLVQDRTPISQSTGHILNQTKLSYQSSPYFSNKITNAANIRKIYCLVVQILLNMFQALQCPSSGVRQTAVAASGFRMNVQVEVFSALVGLSVLVVLVSY